MLASYLATDDMASIVRNVREVFGSEWVSVDDVRTMFKLCVHELSLRGHSK